MDKDQEKQVSQVDQPEQAEDKDTAKSAHKLKQAEGEIGGPAGLEPTRYGDWERKGIISDF